MSKKAFVVLLVLAVLLVLLVLFFSNLIWGETWRVPPQFKYDVLKDTLTIVLSGVAIVIAIVGYGIYLILSGRLSTESAATARLETLRESIRAFVHIGFVFWESYDKTGEKENHYVEVAIGLTERALLFFNELPDREAQSKENDKLLCKIKNNLAYYYAIRRKPEDGDIAKEYAEYIHVRMSKCVEEKENWLDTYNFVHQQYRG